MQEKSMSKDFDQFFETWDTAPRPDPDPKKKKKIKDQESEEDRDLLPTPPIDSSLTSYKQGKELNEIKVKGQVTEEQRELLKAAIVDATLYGTEAASLTCRGSGYVDSSGRDYEACPYLLQCPIYRTLGEQALPLTDACPVERALLENWNMLLAQEMDVDINDPGSYYDQTIVAQRAGIQLLMRRAMLGMANQPLLERILETDNGKFKTKLVVGNMNADFFLKALAADAKLTKEALLTRKGQQELLRGGFKDKSRQAAEMQRRIHQHVKTAKRTIKVDKETGLPVEMTQTIEYDKDQDDG